MLLIGYNNGLRFEPEGLFNKQVNTVVGGQCIDLILIGMRGNHIKRLPSYGTR